MVTLTIKIIFSLILLCGCGFFTFKILKEPEYITKENLIQFFIIFVIVIIFSSIALYLAQYYKLDSNIVQIFKSIISDLDKNAKNNCSNGGYYITIIVLLLLTIFSITSSKKQMRGKKVKNKDLMRKYQSNTDKMFYNMFDEYFIEAPSRKITGLVRDQFIHWINTRLNLNIPLELCDEFGTNLKYFKFEDREEKYLKDISEEEKENMLKELDKAFEFYTSVVLKAKKEYFKEIEKAVL